jgi:hypothetical protein
MFFKFDSVFLLILNFLLDPWKNTDDILLIVKITFKRLGLLEVDIEWICINQQIKCNSIEFCLNLKFKIEMN